MVLRRPQVWPNNTAMRQCVHRAVMHKTKKRFIAHARRPRRLGQDELPQMRVAIQVVKKGLCKSPSKVNKQVVRNQSACSSCSQPLGWRRARGSSQEFSLTRLITLRKHCQKEELKVIQQSSENAATSHGLWLWLCLGLATHKWKL